MKTSPFGSKTNNLTQAAVKLLSARGCTAWRQNNHPVPIEPSKDDVLAAAANGGKLKLKFRKNPQQLKGIGDVQGTLPWGQSIYVEIKTGRDRQSQEQKMFQDDIIRRNGIYLIIKNTDQLIYYTDLIFEIFGEIKNNYMVLTYFQWNINKYINYNFYEEFKKRK